MTLVASVDYAAKRIYLTALTANTDLDTLAVYREVRALRRTNELHRDYRPMIEAGGNIPKIPSVSATPAYVRLLHGCRIVPWDSAHKLRLVRDTFTDDGLAGRDCFDRSSLAPSSKVDIDVDFPEVEIRTVSGGSALTTAEAAKLDALWKLQGLDAASPLVVTAITRAAGDVSQTIAESAGTVTVTRQP
jgi:hypothetical protein